MANVRCPMCSKINPPDAESCAYCGARLKPVRPPSGGSAGAGSTPSTPKSGDSEPDWLLSLRSDEPSGPADSGSAGTGDPGDENADMPDWLSRIRDRARSETSPASEVFGQEKEEAPDWMKGSPQEPSADLGSDFLDRLNSGAGASQPPAGGKPAKGAPAAPESPSSGLDANDWLRGLAEEPAQQAPSEPAGSPAGEDDWMRSLTSWQPGAGSDETTSGVDEPAAAGSAQDEFSWLDSLGGESGAAAPAAETGAGDSDSFDLSGFLSNLNQPSDARTPPAPAEEKGRESSGFGLTGFLTNIEQPQPGLESERKPEQPRQTGSSEPLPWESQPAQPEEGGLEWGQAGQEEAPLDFSGFLSSLETPAPTETGDYTENAFPTWNQSESAAASEALPDWLSGKAAPPEQPVSQPGDAPNVPDWLRDLEAEAAKLEQPGEPSVFQSPAAKPPAMETSPTPPPAQPPAGQPAAEVGLPDWLQGGQAEPPKQQAAPSEGGLPSWLAGFEAPSAAEADEPLASQQAAAQPPETSTPANLPSWLSELQEAQLSSQTSQQPPVEVSPVQQVPPAQQVPPVQQAPAETPEPQEAEAGLMMDAEGAEGLPDWFSQLETEDIEKTQPRRTGELKSEKGTSQPLAPSTEGAEESSVPDWLRSFNTPVEGQDAGPSVPPLVGTEDQTTAPIGEGDQPFAVELPDWLEEDAMARNLAVQAADVNKLMPDEPVAEGSTDNLAQAELPEWVKEMRPIESIIPGEAQMAEADQRVEKAGPLAGMRGVLPAEDLVTRFRKPPTYSIKLRVTEKQRSQASTFDRILAQESQPLLIPPVRSNAPGALLRIIVALALIVALSLPMAYPFFMGSNFAPLAKPELNPPELLQMFERLEQGTSSTTRVLLAVDYEPGLSGEMRLASAAVIEQLVKKNVPITVISTEPTGPALAEQLIGQAQSANPQYNVKEKLLNLGYLPGGTISLMEFAQFPQQAAPVTISGSPAWEGTFLKGVTSISGFSQIIVLTDRAETGRSWVEQVQPYLGSVPLFVVTSAQAAPLLYPYWESGQISGMVSGVLGGAMYAERAGQPNNETLNYLGTYQVGITLALLVVVIGGLVSGGMVLFKRGAKNEE